MPGYSRELYTNQYYHIMHRSNNKIYLFEDEEDFLKYLDLVKKYFIKARLKCFHYVLMNTHVHFVVKITDRVKEVPLYIKLINLKYTFYYKRKYGYEGGLWRNRYKAELIDTDRYMLGCGLYVESNPVKAGIVASPGDYRWSSYSHWVGKTKDELLSDHPLDNVKNYEEIAEEYIKIYVEYNKLINAPRERPGVSSL